MAVGTYTLPNLIQGVSQQSPEQRRTTQMEAEANCINSADFGLLARNGFNVQAVFALDGDDADAAFHEIFRGDEHYLVVVPHTTATGLIRVFDVNNDYAECTVTGGTGAYLATGTNPARSVLSFQTAGDHTFIANQTISPAMTSTVQSTRPPEALIFVKAGSYLQTYTVAIVYGGNKYVWSYKTPDNSVAANAEYISTSQIAATFYRAMTGGAAGIPVTGAADDGFGVGAMFTGDAGGTSGSVVTGAATTAVSLGFTLELKGNVIRVYRTDSNDFTIDCGDSAGNTFMTAIKDKVRSLDDLPERAFEGVRFAVSGVSKETTSEYFVEYTSDDVWQECPGAGTHTALDPDTMPHALINTGVGTFTFGTLTWSPRVVGDETSDPDKYFIGESIKTLFFHQERLGILTEGAYDLSKARNSFSYFRDTMQTVLATDPISSPVSGSKSISLLRRAVLIDEGLYLWAQGAQYRVVGGADGFRPESVENKPSSAFDFSEECQPVTVGPSVYFATDGDDWSRIRQVIYSGGRAQQTIDVTAHLPEYIPSGVHWMAASETLNMLFVLEASLRNIWHYNYVVQGSEIVQSAWNQWQFPLLADVVWCSEYRGSLNMAVIETGASGTNLVLGNLPLTTSTVDPGGDYLTRLDFRVDETQCVSVTYDGGTGQTTIVLPYDRPTSSYTEMVVAIRTTAGLFTRGDIVPLVSGGAASTELVVTGDISAAEFYVGAGISSFTTLTRFYARPDTVYGKGTATQADFPDDTTVERMYVSHTGTRTYSVVVTPDVGSPYQTDLNVSAAEDGILNAPIQARADQHSVQLINSSIYPSAWQRIKVAYQSVDHFDASAKTPAAPKGASEKDLEALRNEVTAKLSTMRRAMEEVPTRSTMVNVQEALQQLNGRVSTVARQVQEVVAKQARPPSALPKR